jgi:hypothetical protein
MKLSDGKVKLLSRNYHKLHQCIYILYRQWTDVCPRTYFEMVGSNLLSTRLKESRFQRYPEHRLLPCPLKKLVQKIILECALSLQLVYLLPVSRSSKRSRMLMTLQCLCGDTHLISPSFLRSSQECWSELVAFQNSCRGSITLHSLFNVLLVWSIVKTFNSYCKMDSRLRAIVCHLLLYHLYNTHQLQDSC